MKFVAVIIICILSSLNLSADQEPPLRVEARIDDGIIYFSLKNLKKGIVYIANPDKAGFWLDFKEKGGAPIGGTRYNSKTKDHSPFWKHLVVLIKPREASPSLGIFNFKIEEKRNFMKHADQIFLTLYLSDQKSFEQENIASLKKVRLPVHIIKTSK